MDEKMKAYVVVANHLLDGLEVVGVLSEKSDASVVWDFALENTTRSAGDFKENCTVNCYEFDFGHRRKMFNRVLDRIPEPGRKVHLYTPIDDHWISGFYSADVDDFLSVETRERILGATHWTEQPNKPEGTE
jgi:hypothetical protein